MVQFAPCVYETCSPPQHGGNAASADGDTPADRSAYMRPGVSPCLRSVC